MTFELGRLPDAPSLPLRARIIVEGALSGLHRARLRGSSVEFEQHKEYSPGDELRHLDWKVYGKADRFYVKQFEQEAELTAHLILDASGSMGYRSVEMSKLDYGAHVLAALAHLLIHQRDKVGLYAFGDPALEQLVPPRARPAHLRDILSVLSAISDAGASGEVPLSSALERVAEISARRRGLVVVVSDLFERSRHSLQVLRWLRARGHDVVVFHLLDPHELSLPFEGLTMFRSLEGGGELLTNPNAIRGEYQRRMREFLAEVDASLKSAGVEYHQVETSQDLVTTVRNFLHLRLRGAG